MAAGSTSLATLVGNLKRVYGEGIYRQQNLKARSSDMIAKTLKKYNAGGAGFYGSINDSGNESGGAINELEQFRTIDSEDYQQFVVTPKVLAWPIEFSGLAAEAANADEEAFANSVIDAIDMAKNRCLSDNNRQFFGLGTGLLGLIPTLASGAQTSATVDTTQYFRKGQVVDIYNGATAVASGVRLTDVNRFTNVITFASTTILAGGPYTNAQVVKQNIRTSAPTDGKEMMGLRGIVDDGTDLATFEGLTVSSNLIWRSGIIAAGGANLTSDLLQRSIDNVDILSGDAVDLILMHQKQKRKYLDIVVPQKRYMDGKMDSGNEMLSFNGIDLFVDKDCQQDTVYTLCKKYVEKFEVKALTMGTQEDANKFFHVPNFDKYQAYWIMYSNFGSGKRNALGKINGLAVPTGIS